MEYVYAAMLLHKAGKKITEDAVKSVLTAAGVTVDDARVKALVAALEGVNIDEAVQKAAFVAPVAAVSGSGDATTKDTKEEKKKEAADEKKAEESAAAGLGALFG
ncbi:50S ribosomal protein P1 [Candidatus Woesearchaeota archaeon CG10_big_fil_rev_8_21_14_0_10_36_11]|nr:MAG: 50S ribosomal protein P1 [Candidatus Woesearchaeota archaeon CG10_big_fil_rev_8_21_14_0_10_36_11]